MRRLTKWTMGAGIAVALGTGLYLWVQGAFIPEPEITLPPIPPISQRPPVPPGQQGVTPAPVPQPTSEPKFDASNEKGVPNPAAPKTEAKGDPNPAPTPQPPAEPKTQPKAEPTTQAPPAPTQTAPAVPATAAKDPRLAQIEAAFRPAFESLQTQCEAQLHGLADSAIAEYAAGGKTASAKAAVAAKYLPIGRKLQTTCEGHFQSLLSSLESELRMGELPLTLLNEIKRAYSQRVNEMKSILIRRAGL